MSSIHFIITAFRGDHVSSNNKCNLMYLVAVLVTYDIANVDSKMYNIHKVMPEMMIKFSDRSIVHPGLILLYK